MKTFFSKIKAFFVKVFGSGNLERTISGVITVTAPLVETLVALYAGSPAAAAVQAVVNQVQADLGAVTALVQTIQEGAPVTVYAQITNLLNSVKGNLAPLLQAADVKDQATLAKVTAIVNTVVGEVDAILSELPAPPATPPSVS